MRKKIKFKEQVGKLMKRAYITGRGLVTPLGIGQQENIAALQSGVSGICAVPEFIEHNLESHVGGMVKVLPDASKYDRKQLRFCQPNALFALEAVSEALAEAQIDVAEIPKMRIALIGGVAGSYFSLIYSITQAYCESGRLRDVSPVVVPRVMPSSTVANLSLHFGFNGESYDVSAACSSGAIAVMQGARLIESGMYDIVVAGGAENLDWVQGLGFTAARALSRAYNDCPEKASRPFDTARDGFVLAEGAGFVVLESEESMQRRGVKPITCVSGCASNSNAKDMVVPDAAASEAVMREAVKSAGLAVEDIAYVNTHGTATKVGDPVEMDAIKAVFGSNVAINSTKSQTGHMIGATGAVELIFSSLMMEHRFISPSINLDNPEPDFAWADLVRTCRKDVTLKHILSNSFAFGGSNISVVLSDCVN
ncbi:MAG: beta-ketoacyl-[acyl-carrier-protein] synthase family protein [Lentisphaerae bacterium]|nr:beta-ketoacyl-[acyl-carrier-protein] synthase family protein [Lentisphaerota bacterium]